jgi:hypothetical protein
MWSGQNNQAMMQRIFIKIVVGMLIFMIIFAVARTFNWWLIFFIMPGFFWFTKSMRPSGEKHKRARPVESPADVVILDADHKAKRDADPAPEYALGDDGEIIEIVPDADDPARRKKRASDSIDYV